MRRERVTPKPLVFIHRVSGESTDRVFPCERCEGATCRLCSFLVRVCSSLSLWAFWSLSPECFISPLYCLDIKWSSSSAVNASPSDQRSAEKPESRRNCIFFKSQTSRVNNLNPYTIWCIVLGFLKFTSGFFTSSSSSSLHHLWKASLLLC